jgi:Family of unknown function (DUF6152)
MPRLLAAILLIPAVLGAHHSTADYDLRHPASATGVVTRFEWANPHSYIYLDVTVDGDVEHWIVEIDGPHALERLGWSKDSLKPGDRITCSGARAKDGSPRLRCTQVVLADGRALQSF